MKLTDAMVYLIHSQDSVTARAVFKRMPPHQQRQFVHVCVARVAYEFRPRGWRRLFRARKLRVNGDVTSTVGAALQLIVVWHNADTTEDAQTFVDLLVGMQTRPDFEGVVALLFQWAAMAHAGVFDPKHVM